jgi:hypothetical protein
VPTGSLTTRQHHTHTKGTAVAAISNIQTFEVRKGKEREGRGEGRGVCVWLWYIEKGRVAYILTDTIRYLYLLPINL